jgi:hypothetical protein
VPACCQWQGLRRRTCVPPLWQGLSRAIANLSTSAGSASILVPGLPPLTAVSAPFVQLTEALNNVSAVVLMPVVEETAAVAQDESGGWMGLWAHITAGLTRLFEGLSQRLGESLGQRLAASRSTITSLTSQHSITRSLTETAAQQHHSQWEATQHSITRSLTEISTQQHHSQWEAIQHSITRSLTETAAQQHYSRWEAIRHSITRSLTETAAQQHHSQWEAIQHSITRSLTEISTQYRETNGLIPPSRLNESSAVPQISAAPLLSDSLSSPLPTMTAFSSPNTILTQWSQPAVASLPPPRSQAPPEASTSPASMTFNGGIHVQITTQTVDMAHADETARVIANQVLQEINRITDQSRFRRGLPPAPLF